MPKYAIRQVIEALRAHHGLLVLAADELGCSRQTLYNYAQRFPEVAQVLVDERERLVDLAEHRLYAHVQEGAPWAIALVLKTLGRARGYGDRPIEAESMPALPGDVIVIRSDAESNGHHA